jgi:large subunit ribosomal protein L23
METKTSKVSVAKRDISNVLVRPHITEKAASESVHNAYAFEIASWATKGEVKKAVELIYKVTPVKVNVVHLPAKKVVVRGKKGTKSGKKKAYVFLKKGDKIEFI